MNKVLLVITLLSGLFLCPDIHADESDLIKADRQALIEANATGLSSKIIAAKEQLSDDLWREEDQRRKDLEGVSIPLVPDDQGHLLADVIINNKIHASLIVDTGSPVVMLNSIFIQELGLDMSQFKVGYIEVLNGKHKAIAVTLNSVKIGDAKAQDVSATIMLEDNKEIKNGILGMSFLSKFHFTLDQAGQRLILKKGTFGT